MYYSRIDPDVIKILDDLYLAPDVCLWMGYGDSADRASKVVQLLFAKRYGRIEIDATRQIIPRFLGLQFPLLSAETEEEVRDQKIVETLANGLECLEIRHPTVFLQHIEIHFVYPDHTCKVGSSEFELRSFVMTEKYVQDFLKTWKGLLISWPMTKPGPGSMPCPADMVGVVEGASMQT